MGKKPDSELYLYHRRFRIHRPTLEIISMSYVDEETGRKGTLRRPKGDESMDPSLYLPRFIVGTLVKSELDDDSGFKKALAFQRKFCQENHARFVRAKAHYEWLEQFEDFESRIEKFEDWRKLRSPNNYRNDIAYLKNYVLKFYLHEKAVNNPMLWAEHHNEFREWLGKVQPVSSGLERLSRGTRNNILRSLHAFYKYMEEVDGKGPFRRCRLFSKNELNAKDEKSVIPKEVAIKVIRDLESLEVNTGKKLIPHRHGQLLSRFFRLLMRTGLRKNEALGLSLDSVRIGQTREDFRYIFDAIKGVRDGDGKRVECYGYIYLLDQPSLKSIRSEGSEVPRKPLKLKPKIDPKYSRVIPIIDKDVARDLVVLINEQKEELKRGTHGKILSNYLLFDGLVYQTLNKALNQLFDRKDYKDIQRFTPHDTRHTFTTEFVRLVGGNVSIVSRVLGHSREEVTQGYLHLSQMIDRKAEIHQGIEDDLDPDNIKAI